MRNISFMLTTDQVAARQKTVTRRVGWKTLKPGELLCAVKKCQGLKRGEKIERLGVVRVVDVRRERLDRMLTEPDYGHEECRREGFTHFPKAWPSYFVDFFCGAHDCAPEDEVTRIEFEYVDEVAT